MKGSFKSRYISTSPIWGFSGAKLNDCAPSFIVSFPALWSFMYSVNRETTSLRGLDIMGEKRLEVTIEQLKQKSIR